MIHSTNLGERVEHNPNKKEVKVLRVQAKSSKRPESYSTGRIICLWAKDLELLQVAGMKVIGASDRPIGGTENAHWYRTFKYGIPPNQPTDLRCGIAGNAREIRYPGSPAAQSGAGPLARCLFAPRDHRNGTHRDSRSQQ